MKEIHDLRQRLLGLVLAGHILERDAGLTLDVDLGVALSHAHDAASAAHARHKDVKQENHQGERQYPLQNDRQNAGAGVGLGLAVLHPGILKPLA